MAALFSVSIAGDFLDMPSNSFHPSLQALDLTVFTLTLNFVAIVAAGIPFK
jgi:hypothetical protein